MYSDHEEDVDDKSIIHDSIFQPIRVPTPIESKVSRKPRLKQKSYRKKVETSWSHENILKLIKEVKTRRCLWDVTCPDYKLNKERIWQEVADSIPVSYNDCKGKWTNLRTTFGSNLAKFRKRKSGQDNDEQIYISWRYFKPMMFLESAKVNQSTVSATYMQSESATTDESVVNDLGFSEELSSSVSEKHRTRKNAMPSSMPLTLSGAAGRNAKLKEIDKEALESMGSRDSQSKDASTVFCEYIAAELRTLSAEQAALARAKLRRAFNDIIDEVVSMGSV